MSGRATGGRVGCVITVSGRVQGVGFRPFVHRAATCLGLDGWVLNSGGQVELFVAGAPAAVRALVERLHDDAPPLAEVRRVVTVPFTERLPAPGSGFAVRTSTGSSSTGGDRAGASGRGAFREIPPDVATCAACLAELFDPVDRRYRYPFVNCTDCGPRATVIEDLPYDRVRTTMRHFALCAACRAEYEDPGDRRFHAEPVACPACGPRLAFGALTGEAALHAAGDAVREGAVIAVKGLGGYQLVCDATEPRAVALLRARKRRPVKPFAVMAYDMAAVRRLAHVSKGACAALTSPARPVVLLAARTRTPLAAGVHPGTDRVGVFLPTAGLHHLLLHDLDRPLVVTSGNLSGGPLVIDDTAAHSTLAQVADGFLTHDRQIQARYDDSASARCTERSSPSAGHAVLPLLL